MNTLYYQRFPNKHIFQARVWMRHLSGLCGRLVDICRNSGTKKTQQIFRRVQITLSVHMFDVCMIVRLSVSLIACRPSERLFLQPFNKPLPSTYFVYVDKYY